MGFLVVVCLGVWVVSEAMGQNSAPMGQGNRSHSVAPTSSATGPVAVINLAKLVREHPKFNAQLSQLRTQIQEVEKWLQKENQALANKVDQLKEYSIGSEQYSKLDDEIAQKRVDLDSYVKKTERSVAKEQAKIQYQAFKEIQQEIQNYCLQNGITTVIHSATPTDVNPENPREVGLTMSQPVVWSSPQLNITEKILQRIQQKHASRPAPSTGGQNPQY
jgi:Skp family chaperone for outer membrane proteins